MPSMLDAQRSTIGSLAKLGDGVRANSDAKTQAGLSRGAGQSKKLVNAAWTQTFPAQGATLDLDFANDRGFVRGVGQGRSMDAVTFTRASNATFVGSNGLLQGGFGDKGALAKNMLTSPQDFDNGDWAQTNVTVIANAITAPNGTLTAEAINSSVSSNIEHGIAQVGITVEVSTNYTWSCYFKKKDYRWALINAFDIDAGDVFCYFDLENGVLGTINGDCTATITDVGNGWYRCTVTRATVGDTASLGIYFTNADNVASFSATIGFGVFAWGAQLEVGSTATEYFPTNINQPRFDWASTAITGAGTSASPFVIPLLANSTSNGLLIEEARTNRALWCRDATQTNWVKVNVTASKNQTGIDGVANACSSLTSTLANGTCVQSITLSSGSRTSSVYLKRITGTGNIQVSLDGTTYSTVDLSNGLWNRIVISATVLNPVVGIRIVTSGDAVAMDFGQVEDGAFATSPIMTTTATVTRSADAASMTGNNFDGWMSEFGTITGNHLYFYTGDAGETIANSLGAPCGLGTAVTTNQFNPIVLNNTGSVTRQAATYYRSPTLAVGINSTVNNVYIGNIFLSWAVRIQNYSYGLSVNSSSELIDNQISGTIKSRFVIGGNSFQTGFSGYIKYLRFFPVPKNGSSLQALSGQAT
jgi:hypothetical protein